MKRAFSHTFSAQAGNVSPAAVAAFILMGMLLVPDLAMAQALVLYVKCCLAWSQ